MDKPEIIVAEGRDGNDFHRCACLRSSAQDRQCILGELARQLGCRKRLA
jgi:hypothetical protein